MNKESNIALITALYNTKHADFYKEIYFPIIKYTIIDLIRETNDYIRMYDIEGLQERIRKVFSIDIPAIVLSHAISAIERSESEKDVRIHVYGDGSFKIYKINCEEEALSIANKADLINEKYRQLNILFGQYLQMHQYETDKTLSDFIRGYEQEIFLYIQQSDSTNIINQDFALVARFIEYIKDNNDELFNTFNDLMWGATISGFLQRDNVELGINTIEKVHYYLDTSIVLSLLELDCSKNILHAQDLLRIIKNAGSVPCVHAMTMREISRILQSVEIEGVPRVGSKIEAAFVERHLEMSDILHVKNDLLNILENKLEIVVENVSTADLNAIEVQYKSNTDVKYFANLWGNANDNFSREIHDVYLHNIVEKKNTSSPNLEKIGNYFVTLNNDVLAYYKSKNKSISIIHASRVIMNLWIHNVKTDSLQPELLSNVLSRCAALTEMDVRSKIAKISKYYQYYLKSELSEEDVANMYSCLITRSAKTLAQFEQLENLDESSADDRAERSQKMLVVILQTAKEDSQSRKAVESNQKELDEKKRSLDELSHNYNNSIHTIDELQKQVESVNKENAEMKLLVTELQEEREIRTKIEEFNAEIQSKQEACAPLLEQQKRSIKMCKYWIPLILEIVCVLALLGGLCVGVYQYFEQSKSLKELIKTWYSVASIIAFLGIVLRAKDMILLSPQIKYDEFYNEQLLYWNRHHPELQQLQDEIDSLNESKAKLTKI